MSVFAGACEVGAEVAAGTAGVAALRALPAGEAGAVGEAAGTGTEIGRGIGTAGEGGTGTETTGAAAGQGDDHEPPGRCASISIAHTLNVFSLRQFFR